MRRLALALALATVGLSGAACGDPDPPAAGADARAPGPSASENPSATPTGPKGEGGEADASAGPARADVPAIPCADPVDDVYREPAGLAAMTLAARGAVVRCATEGKLDGATIDARLPAEAAVARTSEATVHRIAFRTYREDGVAGVSSARVYLPTKPRSATLPVIVVAHPTVGLADDCAPSKDEGSLADLALPFAARGFAVIAPDYAGLGTDGVQGYTANRDTAHSVLDGARALRAMLAPGALDARVLLVGYSQGGGAVLASQAIAREYGAGGDVVGAIVFAPQFASRIGSFGYEKVLRSPSSLTIMTGVSKPVVAALRGYAAAHKILGPANAGAIFPAAKRSGIEQAMGSMCQTPFGGYLQGVAPKLGDLFDEGYRASMLACIDGASGCAGPASEVFAWMTADLVAPDPAGAPILYVQGLADTIMPANEEAACNLDLLKRRGVAVQACVDGPAAHTSVVPRNVGFALAWGEAKLDGKPVPGCSDAGMPACAP